jgi:hypothetical protein
MPPCGNWICECNVQQPAPETAWCIADRQDSENGKMAMNPNHYPALRNIHSMYFCRYPPPTKRVAQKATHTFE